MITKAEFDQVLVQEQGFSQDLADVMWENRPTDSMTPVEAGTIVDLREYVRDTLSDIQDMEAQLRRIRKLESSYDN